MHLWTIPLPSWVKRVLSERSPVTQAQVVQRVGEDRDDAVAVFEGQHRVDDDRGQDRDDQSDEDAFSWCSCVAPLWGCEFHVGIGEDVIDEVNALRCG